MILPHICFVGLSLACTSELAQLEFELRTKLKGPVVISPTWEMNRTKSLFNLFSKSNNLSNSAIEQRLELTAGFPSTLRNQAFPIRLFPYFRFTDIATDMTLARQISEKAITDAEIGKVKVEKGQVLVQGIGALTLPISHLERIPLRTPIRTPKLFDSEVVVVSPGQYTEAEFVTAVATSLGTKPSKDNNVLRLDPTVAKNRWLAYLESTRRFAINEFLTNKHEGFVLAAKYASPADVCRILEDQTKYLDIMVSANVLLQSLAKRCYETYVERGAPVGSDAKHLEFRERFRSRIDLDDPRPIRFRFYGTGHMDLMFPANDGKAYVAL